MDANTLSFVVSSTSTILSTPLGPIEFYPDEFVAYKCLFEIIDIDEDGRISFNNSVSLLQRSLVPRATLLQAWGILCAHKDEDVVFEQWLVLCKVVSHIQTNGNQIMELPRILSCRSIPFLDLSLRTTVPSCEQPYGSNALSALDIDVTGWEEVGEGLQKHVRYRVRYVTSLDCFSKTDWEVNRRYSDFKLLAEVLCRYEGSLIPPLPPKQMINSLTHDLPAQRAQELSLFLKNIARHPALYGSFEFRIFLEASVAGFDAFKALVKKIPDIEHRERSAVAVTAQQTSGQNSAYGNSSSTSCGRSSSNYTATATAVGSAAVGYAWGMWTSVNKLLHIPTVTETRVSTPSDPRLEESFAFTFALLSALSTATVKMGVLLDVNKKIFHEMSRISHYMRLAGELEGNWQFDRCVTATSKSVDMLLSDIHSNLDLQTLEIYFHLQNLARFHDVLKTNQTKRLESRHLCDEKYRKVTAAQAQMASVQRSNPSDLNAVGEASDVIRAAEEEVRQTEQKNKAMMDTTQRDLDWLNQVAKFELQGRVLGFVQMRAAASRREVETWENLLADLKGVASSQPPVAYEEEGYYEDDQDIPGMNGSFM